MKNLAFDYQTIFSQCETSLRSVTDMTEQEFDQHYSQFVITDQAHLDDDRVFDIFRTVLFASGFKAATVDRYRSKIAEVLPTISTVAGYSDADLHTIYIEADIINHKKKIFALRDNAIILQDIIAKYGSFVNYLKSFGDCSNLENLLLLKETLQYTFKYIGPITVYHLLTDFGYNVLKPDRVVVRIFERLGLLESRKQLLKASLVGRAFAKATGKSIRYIDIIFVKYGQSGKNAQYGLTNGICLESQPKCDLCGMYDACTYDKKTVQRIVTG